MSLTLAQQKKRKITYSYLALVPFLIFFLFPLYWMLITSFKTDNEISSLRGVPLIIQSMPTLAHYKFILKETRFLIWFKNSFMISAVVTVLTMVVSVLGAYAISRLRFFGSRYFGVGIFCTYLVPPALLFIPFYKVVGLLGLLNTKWCLLFLYPTLTVPFCTWILIGYFAAIPRALDEAAFVDGATYIQMLTKVFLPVAAPGLIAATLFAFTVSWAQFLYPLAYIYRDDEKVLTNGIYTTLIKGDVYFWGELMGGALLASIPVVILFAFLMDYYVAGLTRGSIK
ncbi:MAG: carbohydrate ABC transporter permease [Desulfobacterales bacterium]|nr:MAG: carbohydrate ABC transporter permease [Desulfobacterales bacterium]